MNLTTTTASSLVTALSSSRGVFPSRFAIGDRVLVQAPAVPARRGIVVGVQFTSCKVHYLVDPETQDPANASPTYLVDSAFVDEVDNDHPQSLEPTLA